MGFFDSVKNRLAVNLKVTKLSFQTQPADIVRQCRELTPDERLAALNAIEAMFRWQSVGQIAQQLFPAYSYGGGVSADAKDLIMGGCVDAGVELMRQQNQPTAQPGYGGMLPIQQAALSFAWIVLKALDQAPVATAHSGSSFCTACGSPRPGRRDVLRVLRPPLLAEEFLMETHLQDRRDQAMQRIWDLQDSGLPDSSPQVVAAAQSAIAELRQVLREAGPAADPAESGLTWKYQGDAWFTLREAGHGHEALLEARKAYAAGEPILEAAGATLPLAKLNLNLANTLRVIDGGYNRTHMEEARVRYQRAARLFQQANPSAVPAVLDLLQNLEIAIRAAGIV